LHSKSQLDVDKRKPVGHYEKTGAVGKERKILGNGRHVKLEI
jgi:hypothetical protein